MCFSPLLKSTLFATPNVSPPTVFDLGGWNDHHFVGNWVAETVTYHFFNIQSLSSKNMQHKKKYVKNMIFGKKKFIYFSNVYYLEIKKNVCGAVRLVMENEIKSSNLFFICKIVGWDRFPAGPPKSVYFLCNSFSLRFSEKVLKQTMFGTAWYICFV